MSFLVVGNYRTKWKTGFRKVAMVNLRDSDLKKKKSKLQKYPFINLMLKNIKINIYTIGKNALRSETTLTQPYSSSGTAV